MTYKSRCDRWSFFVKYQLSNTTSISFISLLSFSDEEYTSAPDARESINSAKRDLSRLGSYYLLNIARMPFVVGLTLRISSRSSLNPSAMLDIQNLLNLSFSTFSCSAASAASVCDGRNDGMGTGCGDGERPCGGTCLIWAFPGVSLDDSTR